MNWDEEEKKTAGNGQDPYNMSDRGCPYKSASGRKRQEEADPAAELIELKRRILESERLSIVDMEQLLEKLRDFCEILEERARTAAELHERAGVL